MKSLVSEWCCIVSPNQEFLILMKLQLLMHGNVHACTHMHTLLLLAYNINWCPYYTYTPSRKLCTCKRIYCPQISQSLCHWACREIQSHHATWKCHIYSSVLAEEEWERMKTERESPYQTPWNHNKEVQASDKCISLAYNDWFHLP